MLLDLRDKVVVITGAGRGIGRAIAESFLREGSRVIVTDVSVEALAWFEPARTSAGLDGAAEVCDVCDSTMINSMIADVAERFGRIDVLINNAGVNRRGDLLALSDGDWSLTFDVNVHALFHLCRAALPHMISAGGGSIVNTASQWGTTPVPGHIGYNVSKAAVVSFTENLARDYAPYGIRVNAVAPGEIFTPMVAAKLASSGRSKAELDALVPYGRVGEPAEVAALVAFLASDEAPYLTGSVVSITGAQAAG